MKTKWLRYLSGLAVNNLTKKYLSFFFILLLVPVFVAYQWIVQSAHQIMERDIINKNVLYTDLFVKRLNTEFLDVVYQLQLIASQANEANLDLQTMFQRAKQTIANSSLVYSIYLLDEEKKVVFEAPFHPKLESPVRYAYPKFTLARWSLNYVISELTPNYHHQSAVSIAIPITAKNRQFKGILVAELNQIYLTGVLQRTLHTIQAFGYITDSQGTIIASTDPLEIGKPYENQTELLPIFADSSGVISSKYKGEESIITYQKLNGGWRMVMGVPKQIAFQPIFELSFILTICFATLLLLTLLCIWAAMRNILYPIVKLTCLVKNFNHEQSLQEIKKMKRYHSSDELGILMQTIVEIGLGNLEKQRMLSEKEKYLRDVIEGIPYSLVTMSKHGLIMHVNRQFENLTGFSRAYLVGRRIWELPITEDKVAFSTLFALDSRGQTEEKETYILDSRGQKYLIKMATSPFYDGADHFNGVIAVLQDISQLKFWEEHARQNERLAVFGQITAGIAHEIKNPLAILSGASELLKDLIVRRTHQEMVVELTEDIYQVVERMNGILNRFLGFTKMDDEIQLLQMETLLDELLHLLRINFERSHVHLEKEFRVSTPRIHGKYDQLMQAFLNLFLNSLDAMPDGGILHVSMEDAIEDTREWVVIKIQDSGMGIPEENMEWLFRPFYSTKEKGSGLGLAIARNIIHEHQGEIRIESEVNKGTTFICKFPTV